MAIHLPMPDCLDDCTEHEACKTTLFDTGAMRKNVGKLRFDLITPEMDLALAEVLTMGAAKYADRNWEKGIPYISGLVASLKRHLSAFELGEDNDPESGLLHAAHILTNAAFLVTFQMRGRDDLDDRVVQIPEDIDEHTRKFGQSYGNTFGESEGITDKLMCVDCGCSWRDHLVDLCRENIEEVTQ